MNILRWIKLKTKRGIKSTEFKVKLSPSWFSDQFAYVKYSINGGLTWRKLCNSEEEIMNNKCYWKAYIIKLNKGTKDYIVNRFKTHQDIMTVYKVRWQLIFIAYNGFNKKSF